MKTEAEVRSEDHQGSPADHQVRRETRSRFSLTATEGVNPTDALISDFPPPEQDRILAALNPPLWGTLLTQP